MALTAPITTPYPSRGDVPKTRPMPIASGETVRYGELVMAGSDGVGRSCAALAGNLGVQGVSITPGSVDGPATIEIAEGEFLLPATSGAQTMNGTLVFGQANSTVGATGTNLPVAGRCTEFVSATALWVKVGPSERV